MTKAKAKRATKKTTTAETALTRIERNSSKQLAPLTGWLETEELEAERLDAAFSARKQVSGVRKQIEAAKKEILDPLNKARTATIKQAKTADAPWERLEKHIKGLITDHEAALRYEEQRKAERRAKRLEKKGAVEAAEDVREEAAVVRVLPTSTAGSTRESWSAKVTSIQDLCAAVAAGHVPAEYVQANLPALNTVARAKKTVDLGIAGVVGVRGTVVL
jgi:hypothetical protein